MRLIVPTYRRHSNGEDLTLQNIPASIPLTLVVRQDEADAYAARVEQLGRNLDSIWPIPDGAVSGIATTRQWIVDKAIERGESRICMIDDDLHFIVRGKVPETEPGWDYKLRPCDEQDHEQLFAWMEERLAAGYHHAGVSMREGNNRTPGLHVHAESTRGIRCVAYDLEHFRTGQVRFRPEVEGREDLDVTLQLLRLGRPNVVTYHWAQGQRTAENPGGLEGMRPLEQLHDSAEKLAEFHPGLVKLRQKTNKSGGMAGTRTEVTVYWKKALTARRAAE